MRTFLVTGGAGFIGSHIAEALAAAATGCACSITCAPATWRISNHLASKIEFIEGDVTDAGAVAKAVEGVDCVFHEAALASVPRSVERPLDTHAACVTGTVTVLDAARRAGVRRVVYAASSSAYGDQPTQSQARDRPARARSRPMAPPSWPARSTARRSGHLRLRDGGHSLLQRLWSAAGSRTANTRP